MTVTSRRACCLAADGRRSRLPAASDGVDDETLLRELRRSCGPCREPAPRTGDCAPVRVRAPVLYAPSRWHSGSYSTKQFLKNTSPSSNSKFGITFVLTLISFHVVFVSAHGVSIG